MPAAHEWSAIVNPHDNAPVVTNLHQRPKWQGAVRRSHGRTIHTLAICGATSTVAIGAAIDTGNFRMCSINRHTRQTACHRSQRVTAICEMRASSRPVILALPCFLSLNVGKRALFPVSAVTLQHLQRFILKRLHRNNSGQPTFERSLSDHPVWIDQRFAVSATLKRPSREVYTSTHTFR
jgi:hypothetical protein